MRLYHFTKRENVLNMFSEGIRPGSYWCKSINDCQMFLSVYINSGLIESPCDIAYISIDFDEDEIIESNDHNKVFIPCDAYYCPKRINKTRIPRLCDIPLFTVSKAY